MPEKKPEEKKPNSGTFRATAKAAVIGPDGRVLLLTRADHARRGAGKRDLPGGHVDPGETVEETVRREVAEETGLVVTDLAPLPVFRLLRADDGTEIQKFRFVARTDGTEVKTDPEEHSAYEWMTIDEALETLGTAGYEADKRATIEAARDHLEHLDAIGGWKRCLADFENYRKRRDAESAEMGAYKVERLVLDLIPVLDNFHAAAEHVPEEAKDSPWVTGIGYIAKQFEDVLAQNGVTPITPKAGDDFDPARHEAIGDDSDGSGKKAPKIATVHRKGYMMGEKVIAAAKVSVR